MQGKYFSAIIQRYEYIAILPSAWTQPAEK